jgi:hypothetical protein
MMIPQIIAAMRASIEEREPTEAESQEPGAQVDETDFSDRAALSGRHAIMRRLAEHEAQMMGIHEPSGLAVLIQRADAKGRILSKVVVQWRPGAEVLQTDQDIFFRRFEPVNVWVSRHDKVLAGPAPFDGRRA